MEGVDQPVEPFAIALADARPARRRRRGRPDRRHRRRPAVGRPADAPDAVVHRPTAAVRAAGDRVDPPGRRRQRTPTPGPSIVLDAVADDVADAILRDAGVSAANVRRELIAAGGGIPLVLVEAANLLDADQRAGRTELPDPLPIGSSGQRVVDLLLERLAAAGARAPCSSPPPSPTATSCASSTPCASATSASPSWRSPRSTASSMLDGDRLTFRHPLMRSAAYHDAPRADRRAAHRALAGTLPDGLAGAGLAPRPGRRRARRVRRPGARGGGRGSPTSAARRRRAARSWELASRLSPEPGRPGPPAAPRRRGHPRRRHGVGGRPAARPGRRRRLRAPRRRRPHRADPPPAAALPPAAVRRRLDRADARLLRGAAAEVAGVDPDVAVDLLFDALAAYIRDGAFADMASAIEECDAAARPRRRGARPAHRHHGRRPAHRPRRARAASRCSTATPR